MLSTAAAAAAAARLRGGGPRILAAWPRVVCAVQLLLQGGRQAEGRWHL